MDECKKQLAKQTWCGQYALQDSGFEVGWEEALKFVQEVIVERLKLVSIDDNIACVRNIQEDIRRELGLPPEECIRDGYREVCRQCPEKQRTICRSENVCSIG